jgi:hypothetical protein
MMLSISLLLTLPVIDIWELLVNSGQNACIVQSIRLAGTRYAYDELRDRAGRLFLDELCWSGSLPLSST